jgi:hypothetical protein
VMSPTLAIEGATLEIQLIERGNCPTINSKLPKVVSLAIGHVVSNDSYV